MTGRVRSIERKPLAVLGIGVPAGPFSHTAATRLVQQDVPLPLAGRILGHTGEYDDEVCEREIGDSP